MNTIAKRLEALRKIMRENRIDAWIITGSDPHSSEYVAQRWLTRAWITGFTGSAGTVVVTVDRALLWVDSRYFIQAEQQLGGSPFELQKIDTPQVVDYVQWLSNTMKEGCRIGFDGTTMTLSAKRTIERAFIGRRFEVVATDDWFDLIWTARPAPPHEPVTTLSDRYAGLTCSEKIDIIRKSFQKLGCTHHLVASLDDIAWILNARGSDITYNPVFLAYLLIGSQNATLCIDADRVETGLKEQLSKDVVIVSYEDIEKILQKIPAQNSIIYFSPDKVSTALFQAFPTGVGTVEGRDISTDLKAAKHVKELEGIRRAHLLDGLALVRFLSHLAASTHVYDEITLAEKLVWFRKKSDEYIGPSFSPIAGFCGHGALAHYAATPETASVLDTDGLLVLDTGAQYACGTTDVTRTLLFGVPSDEMKRDYTLVLKGNLSLASQRFPKGTTGYQLDILARQHLWQHGQNYGHGTGHGLGFCLNVHEGPQNISPRPLVVPLISGMVISDEPGIYKKDRYGIRLENIITVVEDGETEFGSFLAFEVLTMCPFERKLIDTSLLSDAEIHMVNTYHTWVRDELDPYLDEAERTWLAQATAAL